MVRALTAQLVGSRPRHLPSESGAPILPPSGPLRPRPSGPAVDVHVAPHEVEAPLPHAPRGLRPPRTPSIPRPSDLAYDCRIDDEMPERLDEPQVGVA